MKDLVVYWKGIKEEREGEEGGGKKERGESRGGGMGKGEEQKHTDI